MPVVEGHYTLGLWLVTNGFAGKLFELEDFAVASTRWSSRFCALHARISGSCRP